jgi:hypothetical protein
MFISDGHRQIASFALSIFLLIGPACGGGHMSPPKATGLFLSPHYAVAYSHTSQDTVLFTVNVEYSDGSNKPWTGNVDWEIKGYWVSLNTSTGEAICSDPAPWGDPFLGPEPAIIKATATVDEQSFSDNAELDCL